MNPQTINDVEQLAAKAGIQLHPQDYADAQAIMDERRRQLDGEAAADARRANAQTAWVERFNRWYPKFLQTLLGFGDVLITLTQTVLVGPGVMLVLLMLLIVEQARVMHGVELFEVYPALAAFSAWALVILNLLLELLISWVEHRAGWQEPPRHEFSLRLLWERAAYLFGMRAQWSARPKSPAVRFKMVLRVVTFSIITLAVAGSMKAVISRTGGNWAEAVNLIITQSTLLELLTWAGGLLFTLAAVLSAQALSQYVAHKVVEVVAAMQSEGAGKAARIAEAVGAAGAAALLARVKEYQRARRLATGGGAEYIALKEPPQSVPFVPERSGTNGTSAKRPSPALDKALTWLAANPGHALTVRDAAAAAGVGVATMARAIKQAGE